MSFKLSNELGRSVVLRTLPYRDHLTGEYVALPSAMSKFDHFICKIRIFSEHCLKF